MDKLVSIIIPTRNREKEILSCLESLSKITYSNYEIIVVDDCSSDGTILSIKKEYPNTKLIESKVHLGAGGGRNKGIEYAVGSYLCFVDSDNEVEADFLTELIKLADSDDKIGFVGPKMKYHSNKDIIWYAGATISLFTSKTFYVGINERDHGQYDQVRETGHIPNVWLVKREVVDKIGNIAKVYVTHYEESDWCERARLAGYKVMFCPSSVVYHKIPYKVKRSVRSAIGYDHPERCYFASKNRAIFMKKFASRAGFWFFILVFNNIFLFQYTLIFLFFKKPNLIIAYLRGYFSGIIATFKIQKI